MPNCLRETTKRSDKILKVLQESEKKKKNVFYNKKLYKKGFRELEFLVKKQTEILSRA